MDFQVHKTVEPTPTYVEEDSASEYGASEANDEVSSHDDDEKSTPSKYTVGESTSAAEELDEQPRAEALHGAATFRNPKPRREIQTPRDTNSTKKSQKRPPSDEPNDAIPERKRGRYVPEYRNLLNIDINHAGTRGLSVDYEPLAESQIGSSIWTSLEKDSFFTSLSRFGRDDIRVIASRIGTKSQFEVQQYIYLLQQNLSEKTKHVGILDPADFPAAIEISGECVAALEEVGDALASRQERQEQALEHSKWGDSWLLTQNVSQWLDRRRAQEGGECAIDEVLPAANLLKLTTWLDLSERIFMNAGAPYLKDNWQNLAESGEPPAIRATCLEDFHSLAVHITKKLVSTTLFCTMSRERAIKSLKTKHAEISVVDVEAAINILNMKQKKWDFWRFCARRCNLEVINDERPPDAQCNIPMTYEEVEHSLDLSSSQSHSPSRPIVSQESNQDPNPAAERSSHLDSAYEESYTSADSDIPSVSETDSPTSASRLTEPLKCSQDKEALIIVQEANAEARDAEDSRVEEQRLWEMLKTHPLPNMKHEPTEITSPKPVKRDGIEGRNWRETLDYRSEWEVFDKPVPETAFEANRVFKSWRETTMNSRSIFSTSDAAIGSEPVVDDNCSSKVDEESEEEGGEGVDQIYTAGGLD